MGRFAMLIGFEKTRLAPILFWIKIIPFCDEMKDNH